MTVYKNHARTGAVLLAGAALSAAAGFLIVYGALVGFERPLESWYHKRNH